MNSSLKIDKPEILLLEENVFLFQKSTEIEEALSVLQSGHQVVVDTLFSDGLLLLNAIQKYLKENEPNRTFLEQRLYRSKYQKMSNLIVLAVKNHLLAVKKSPSIGWLKKLYPETDNFYLTFPQVQGLNSSWQWYEKGISIPVLRNKLHPFYGVYFPTRFEHLEVFENWLKRYEGPKKSAIDVGVGSGVLSIQMVQHGFQKVFATDTNPNAIHGLKEFMGETKLSRKIELDFGHLFGKWNKTTELIVFNPPWLPLSHELERLDEAIYYNEELFPAFFKEAKERLLPDGKLIVIFSNLAQITKVTEEHPIQKELETGERFILDKCYTKNVKKASEKTKRDQHWRATEVVELWCLVHKE